MQFGVTGTWVSAAITRGGLSMGLSMRELKKFFSDALGVSGQISASAGLRGKGGRGPKQSLSP